MKSKLLPRLALALLLAEVLLLLLSWLLSAMPTAEVRSLLTGEGLRWLLGRMSGSLSTPILVWIVLLGMAWGCLRQSGLLASFSRSSSSAGSRSSSRDRIALFSVLVLLVFYAFVLMSLTAMPHAILLSATGELFPSPFSASIVPVIAFGITLCAVVYGVVSGRFNTLGEVYQSLVLGLRSVAPVLLFYILIMQIYFTVSFAFL